jgi:uncharacterized membrane-anchored protein YitT (DUF2179 family)
MLGFYWVLSFEIRLIVNQFLYFLSYNKIKKLFNIIEFITRVMNLTS